MRQYSPGHAWKKEQRLDYLILNSLQVHIQQDIIFLWPLKAYQLEIFWKNEFLIYDINNVTHNSVWEYFIIHGVCACFLLSSPSQDSKYMISLNFRERRLRLKWFLPSSGARCTCIGSYGTPWLPKQMQIQILCILLYFPAPCQQDCWCWSWLCSWSFVPNILHLC